MRVTQHGDETTGLTNLLTEALLEVNGEPTTTTPTVTVTTTVTPTSTLTPTTTVTPATTVTPTTTATFTAMPSGSITTRPSIMPTKPRTPGVIDVYTTPCFHNVNGRSWHTTCEAYSQTTRCPTEIWATSIAHVNGKFVKSDDWTFNNLTYLPAPRSLWAGNPPASTNTCEADDGRTWRTECDTALTGRNGCRSFIWGKAIVEVPSAKGTTYQWKWD